MTRPDVVLSRPAARCIFGEIQRWVDHGLRGQGVPLESIAYPLAALVPAAPAETRCPLELLALDELEHMVLAGAAIPPDSIKVFSPANCHFQLEDPARANRRFNAEIDQMLLDLPRLGVCSKLHSHPFSGRPFLSSGDIYHGVQAPAARRWRLRRGLDTAILHVVYPDGDPLLDPRPWRIRPWGAVSGGRRSFGREVTWRVRTWGSGPDGVMEDLGDARVLPQRHPLLRGVRRLPYWSTVRGRRWCDQQKQALRGAGYGVSRNLLGRGWRRYLIQGRGDPLLLALSPDLPRVHPRALRVLDAARDRFEPLDPPRWPGHLTLGGLDLVRLTAHYLGR